MIQKYWKTIKDSVKNDINVVIFCLYLFLPVFFIPVSVILGEKVYKVVFILLTLVLVITSCAKNKKLVSKREFFVGLILLVLFGIDFLLRKNSYTLSLYIVMAKTILVPFYFFNRIEKKTNILKYLSLFSKIAMVMFLTDPLFHYYFTESYMGYGYVIMLPAFLSIYLYHFIEPKENDYLFLTINVISTVIFANRNCILAIFFVFLLTLKFVRNKLKDRKKSFEKIKNNYKKFAVKNLITIGFFVLGFACNFVVAKIDYSIKHPNNPPTPVVTPTPVPSVEPTPTSSGIVTPTPTIGPTATPALTPTPVATPTPVPTPEDDFDLNWNSYSFDKYWQVLNGKMDRILSGRIGVYNNVFKVIRENILTSPISLIFGRGTGYFMSLYEGVYTHCIFFDLFIEYGIVGTILFLILLGYCIYKFKKLSKKDKYLYLLAVYFFVIAFPKLLLSSHLQKEPAIFLFIILMLLTYPIDFKKIFKR